jgi:hypothetical protein
MGNTQPLRCIFHSKKYATYIASRAKASPLCSRVTFNDSDNIAMPFSKLKHPAMEKFPPDMMKFLKEQINEQIEIRNRKEEMQSAGM